MFYQIYQKKIFLCVGVTLFSLISANDYISNEEVTTPNFDFFDNENIDDFFDGGSHLQPDIKNNKKSQKSMNTDEDSVLIYKTLSDEQRYLRNGGALTTMLPDYIHSFQSNNEEDTLSDEAADSKIYDINNSASPATRNELFISPDFMNQTKHNESSDNFMMYGFDEDESEDDIDSEQVEIATTTIASPLIRSKQGKQIQIVKLLPHEALRNFIEDPYIRTPLATLVDTSKDSLNKTKAFWKEALRSNAALDVVLLAFNSSGVGVKYSFKNTRTLLAGLESIQESEITGNSNTFRGIIAASERVPYDSAIFVSTNSIPSDTDLAQLAAITFLKKRIRLYLIWFGDNAYSENETQEVTGGLLGEVAIRSGGEILHVGGSSFPSNEESKLTIVSDNFLRGPQDIDMPVEPTMTDLQTKIDNLMRTTAETPNGDNHLSSKNNQLFESFNMVDEFSLVSKKQNFLSVTNPATHENLRFPMDDKDADIDIDIDEKFNINVTANSKQQQQQIGVGLYRGTAVDLGVQSQLIVTPGMMAQLYFEVTNLREEPTFHNFQVTDTQRFLRMLNPQSIWLPSGNTANVAVTLYIPPNAEVGIKDRITFTSQVVGNPPQSQAAMLKVISTLDTQDTTLPSLNWFFGSRCEGKYGSTVCAESVWILDVTAQDWETGVLRIQSNPKGIIARNSFTAGTNEAVKASYSATCCQPRVTITVYDLAGNQRAATIDVRDIVLTEASIAAIILGILLLLLLITLCIILIRCCIKRRSASRDLPSYRSERAR